METCKLRRIERQRHGCHGRAVAWRRMGWAPSPYPPNTNQAPGFPEAW